MDEAQIIKLVKRAIQKLLREDEFLFKYDLSERCVMHKFAEYLQPRFQNFGYVVDCEYNRDANSNLNIATKAGYIRKVNFYGNPVLPDIIIHKRTDPSKLTDDFNLCVIEIKQTTNPEPRKVDKDKLKIYTCSRKDGGLNYQLGIFIDFYSGEQYELNNPSGYKTFKTFTDGKEHDLE